MEMDTRSIGSNTSTSSRNMECYWGLITRDHEVAILSECEDGAFLFRDCISNPALITLSVRSGDSVCRYRIREDVVVGINESSLTCADEHGNQVNLKHPVARPKGIEPVSSDKFSATYDVPS